MIKNNWKFASKNMDDYDDVEREHDELNSYLKDKIKKEKEKKVKKEEDE